MGYKVHSHLFRNQVINLHNKNSQEKTPKEVLWVLLIQRGLALRMGRMEVKMYQFHHHRTEMDSLIHL